MTTPAPVRARRWHRVALTAVGAIVATTVLAPVTATPVQAAPGQLVLDEKNVAPVTTNGSPALPGDTITYSIDYDCSSVNPGDDCFDAVVTDTLPTFTDIYGNTTPLDFVAANASEPDDWTFDGVVGGTATWTSVGAVGGNCTPAPGDDNVGLCPGDSGALFLTLRVPLGLVPETTPSQLVQNQASVDLAGTIDVSDNGPDCVPPGVETSADPCGTYINALAPSSSISKSGPSSALLNAAGTDPITYTIAVCPGPQTALWPNYTVTDVLPVGATVVGALPYGGTETVAAVPSTPGPLPEDPPVPGTGATLEWSLTPLNGPPVGSDGCLRISFDVRFVNAAAGGDLTNVIGEEKTNTVTAVGSDGLGGTQGLGPATTMLTLDGPVTRFRPSKSTGGNYYVQDGDQVTYGLGASNTSDAEAVAFSEATLTDGPFPAEYTLTEIRTGNWTGAVATVTASIETSPDGLPGNWTQVSTSPSATITTGLGGVRYVRWVFTSTGSPAIGPGWSASGQQLIGTVNGSPPPSVVARNCASLDGVQEGVPQSRGSACADVELETPQPHPSISKTGPATMEPGETITYTLAVSNDPDATGPLVDPQITDCVPFSSHLVVGNLVLGAGWAVEAGPTPSSCDPTAPSGVNTGTFLQFQYTGSLAPGAAAPAITYDITADDFEFPTVTDTPTPPGVYTNTATLTQSAGAPFNHCVQVGCEAEQTVVVLVNAQLQSQKLVQGNLDLDFNLAGTATAGGQVDWKIQVLNTGNVPVENVQYVDIFPHVGDTGVRRDDQNRGSEFAPYLIEPIPAVAGWTVEYSLSDNPCRPEVFGPSSGCDAPAWTTTPDPASLSLYRSIRLTFSGQLTVGSSLEFAWPMATPVFDPTYDDPDTTASPYDLLQSCTIPESSPPYPGGDPGSSTLVGSRTEVAAWIDTNGDGIQQPGEGGPTCPRASNSFAYGVDVPAASIPPGVPDPGRIGAEPPKVDLHVAAGPDLNRIGDRVWEDVDNDGIQDPGELGISDVRVDLLDDLGTVIDTTFTDANGNYSFDGLADDDYSVRFYMPDDIGYVSPQDQSGVAADQPLNADNTDDDSDIPETPTGSDVVGNYYDTVLVTLGNDVGGSLMEDDPTWDAGIWIPMPDILLKKYVNGDDAQTTTGPQIPRGDAVDWTYDITNTGNSYLKDVTLVDDVTISGEADPVPVCDWPSSSDATTPAGVLSRGETVSCTATGTAIRGQYGNNATVTGTPALDDGTTAVSKTGVPPTVSDSDPAHYFGVEYDLALTKTANTASVPAGGNVVWTVTVRNQGNVASGDYTVTDVIPLGMAYVSSSIAPSSQVGRTFTFDRPSLAAGATVSFTITTTVTDIGQRPFRNWAEISADSAATYGTTDWDSVPDTNVGDDTGAGPDPGALPNDDVTDHDLNGGGPTFDFDSDIETPLPGGALDEDDNDYEEVAGDVRYDLALVKTVVPTPLVGDDGFATWTVTVKNQGNVPSGTYTVTDNLPAGLAFQSSTPPPSGSAGRTYTWNMPDLAPGATTTISILTRVTDQSTKAWANWAEISADSSSDYDLPGAPVTDVDSTPDADLGDDAGAGTGPGTTNDLHVDRLLPSDVDTDLGVGVDEDDNDVAVLDSNILYDLALVKVADAPTIAPNGTTTWTITVRNQGNVASGPYTVTDTVADGLTVTGAVPAATGVVGNVYSWDMPSLLPGADATIQVTTTVDDLTLRPFRNWAEISDDSAQALYGAVDDDSTPDAVTGDDDGAGTDLGDPPNDVVVDQTVPPVAQYNDPAVDEDDNDYAEVDVAIEYDLALVKTVAPTTVGEDGLVTWTITVANQGNVDAGSFVVRDVLPGGMTFVTSTPLPAAPPVAGIATWIIPDLAPGATTTITITTRATDLLLRPFRNWAEIASDSASDYDVPGQTVTDDDSVPDTTLGADPGIGTGTGPNDAVQNHNDIGFDAGTPAGFPGVDEDDSDYEDVTSNPIYDLALAKITDTPTVAYDGQPVWRTRVYNQGNVSSGPVVVTDKLPTGLTYESGQVFTSTGLPVVGAACGAVTFTVTCSIPNIAVGDHVDVVLTTSITGGDLSTAPWRNWAEISSDSAQSRYGVDDLDSSPDTETGRDGVPSVNDNYVGVGSLGATYPPGPGFNDPAVDQDDHDDAVVDTTSFYDLALVKVVDASPVLYDDQVTFTVTSQNQGDTPSGTYVVVDRVPDGLNPISLGGGVWSAIDRTITWTMPNLAPGQTADRSYTAVVADVTLRPFRNLAEIVSDSAASLYGIADVDSTPDTDPGNDGTYPPVGSTAGTGTDNLVIGEAGTEGEEDDADIADVDVDVEYDLALAKVVDATDLALAGYETGTATFTITVANQGNVPSGDFEVTDTMPAGIEPVLPVADGGVWSPGARTITWIVPDLLPGATTTRDVTVTVSDITQRVYRNVAEISADSSADYSTATVTVTDVDSTPDTDTANDGTYPPLLSAPGTGIDNLTVGEAGVDDGDPQDDADIADLSFDVVYDLALAKVADTATAAYGDTITYTITVQNQGNVDSGVVEVTDTVPPGLDPLLPVAGAGSWNPTDRTITWTIGNLNGSPSVSPGESTTLTLQAEVADVAQRPFRNIAEISADSADDYDAPLIDVEDADSVPDVDAGNDGTYPAEVEFPTPGAGIDNLTIGEAGTDGAGDEDDADIADVGAEVVYDLQLIKTVDTAVIPPDNRATFTLSVLNQGNVPSGSFTVTDWIPAGLDVIDAGGAVESPGVLTWTITDSLEPGESTSVEFVVEVDDLTLRPYRNVAEISADSSSDYDTAGTVPLVVVDIDSVPDTDPDDDVQVIDQSEFQPGVDGENDPGVDADDHDFALFGVDVEYDLALVKILPAGQSYAEGSTIEFRIEVKNQGNVDSGEFSFRDVVPGGMSFVSATGGGTHAGGVVTWTIDDLQPGATRTVTVGLRLDDSTLARYVNYAEIVTDSADDYSTADVVVTDDDSTPDSDLTNDLFVATDDVDVDQVAGDEDDHDLEELDVALIVRDNTPTTEPEPETELPRTGGGVGGTLVAAGLLTLFGTALLGVRRRRSATVA